MRRFSSCHNLADVGSMFLRIESPEKPNDESPEGYLHWHHASQRKQTSGDTKPAANSPTECLD